MNRQQQARECALAIAQSAPGSIGAAAGVFERMAEALARDGDLRRFVATPGVAVDAKTALLARVAGGHLPGPVQHLLERLVTGGRTGLCGDIGRELRVRADEAAGTVDASVRSALPLTADQRERLTHALAARTGQTVRLAEEVDPALIGGLAVRIHDMVVDNTIRTELAALREHLEA